MIIDDTLRDDGDVTVTPVSNCQRSHARASIVEGGKTSGLTDDDLSHWEQLVHDLPWPEGITLEHIKAMKMHEKLPIAYCVNTKKISELSSFIPAILKKVGRIWEVLDEREDELLEQVTWEGDNGIETNWGMYLKHSYKEYVEYFAKMRKMELERDTRGKEIDVTPGRSSTRAKAFANLQKSASKIKARVEKRATKEKVMELKEVVHIPLKDVDRAKTDPTSLTGVIVMVNKKMAKVRVAVETGLLQNWYQYHQVGRVTGPGNNMELNGLSDAFTNWRRLPEISEREAARNQSVVGGQGHGIIRCKCKGNCSNSKCPCKKAGRICTSACHKGNDSCLNHE